MSFDAERQYSKVLKFGMKFGMRRISETIAFGITIFAITIIYLFMLVTETISPIGKYIFFPLGILAEIVLVLSYIENHYSLDIFGENSTRFFSILSIGSIIIIIIYAVIPSLYENETYSWVNISLIVLFFLITIVETGYFLYSVPRGELANAFGMEKQFKILEKRLETKQLSDIPIERSIKRGINAIKARVTEEGLWGDFNPVYESACVLEFFKNTGDDLSTEWTVSTSEGKKNVSLNTTFQNLSAIITTTEILEMTYEQFFVLYTLSLFDPTVLDPHFPVIEGFLEKLNDETEWDFIGKLNQFTNTIRSRTTPLHFIMSYIGDNVGQLALLDKLSSMFTTSIDIIIRRGYSRFSTSQTGRTSVEMFARLMISLHSIRRMPPKRQQFVKAVVGDQLIEGSWEDDIGTTGYVIQSLIPSEQKESMTLKKAALYLVAVQDKEGLWESDIEKTTIALKALLQLKEIMDRE